MNSTEIRESFLQFFCSKEHTIVPSASLLPTSPNLLFTNAGMNQFVPYFLGVEKAPFTPARAVDTQKCIRASGKHNDLEDVGLDTYHHTFFEMLGNWSFGDYFKKEAIAWAWELVVDRWKFPANRLYATVYKPEPGEPAEFDQEAYDNWAKLFTAAGLDPKIHVRYGNKEDNFWMMGETGPCGPCSELHMDLTPKGDTRGELVNKGDARCIEIWNLVFIQFNANPDDTYTPLAAQHVDTGMGFERVCSIIQGTKNFTTFDQPISNYDTDVFAPIFRKIESLAHGKKYQSTLPPVNATERSEQERVDIAFRVIADHIRTLSFAIADGIIPSNKKRGYVLRSILRRAVRFGRTIGLGGKDVFLASLAESVIEKFGSVFPELVKNQEKIRATLTLEEEAFNKTLDKGIELFNAEISRRKQEGNPYPLCGKFAFKLYDTYGFPLELTRLMARELGITVNEAQFNELMEAQRERSQEAQVKEIISAQTDTTDLDEVVTAFVGYEKDECETELISIQNQKGNLFALVRHSPLYAAKGGQIGDTGILEKNGTPFSILDTVVPRGNAFYLRLDPEEARDLSAPGSVKLKVNAPRRRAIERHHTATHLFHWALHEVVGPDAIQQGSYVGPDRLRFDFNSAALTLEQIAKIEQLVNERILANDPVTWQEVPYTEVRKRPDILQFFGDKYMDLVRVVQIGGKPHQLNGYSMELCGGTHVSATGQIGAFKIVSEGAIAAGVRRVEAVSGFAALEHFSKRDADQSMKLRELEEKLTELNKLRDRERLNALQREATVLVNAWKDRVNTSGKIPSLVENVSALQEFGADLLGSILDVLKTQSFEGVAVLVGKVNDTAHLAISVSPAFTKQFQAGKLMQTLVPLIGGKGGGRPDIARGAGKDWTKIDALVAQAKATLSQ